MRVTGILLCAGSAQRMGFNKLLTPLCGKTAIERSLAALVAGGITDVVFAVSPDTEAYVRGLACPVPGVITMGGETRQASVHNALLAMQGDGEDIAVIHDAARCLVTPRIVRTCVESAKETGSGIAAVPVVDTMFRVLADGAVLVPRENLWRMQTPQAFRYGRIFAAYEQGTGAATDDATLYQQAGYRPVFVQADEDNCKLTTREDWMRAERLLTRYGTGFDTHVLVEGRKLILGGVDIPFEKGLLGHSDADVLVHAIMDAILGAAAMPDIGHLFPDNDPAFAGADSMNLLREVIRLVEGKGLTVNNIDATIIAQRPKMAPHIALMRQNIATACHVAVDQVGIKATTTEKMNDEGRGLCISAQAVATVR